MRCPKCGYISFDRVKSCGKCGNDLLALAEQLKGTGSRQESPFFLEPLLTAREEPESSGEDLDFDEAPAEPEELEVAGLEPLSAEAGTDEPIEEPGETEDEGDQEEAAAEELDLADLLLVPDQEEEPVAEPSGANEVQGLDDTLLVEPPAEASSRDQDGKEDLSIDLALFDEAPVSGAEAAASETGGEEQTDDLSSLLDLSDAPEVVGDGGRAVEVLDLFDEPEVSKEDGVLQLSLESEEETRESVQSAGREETPPPVIPDLGLTLESEES